MIVAAEGGANSRAQRRPPPGAIFRYDCVFPQKGQGMGRVSSMLQGVERVVVLGRGGPHCKVLLDMQSLKGLIV